MKDYAAALGDGAFRRLMTVVVPGFVAVLPFCILVANLREDVGRLAAENATLTVIVVFLLALAVGMVLELIGSLRENKWYERAPPKITSEFFDYMRQAFEFEPVGQEYLRLLVIRLKFELAMQSGLVVGFLGVQLCLLFLGYVPWLSILSAAVLIVGWFFLDWSSRRNTFPELVRLRYEILAGVTRVPPAAGEAAVPAGAIRRPSERSARSASLGAASTAAASCPRVGPVSGRFLGPIVDSIATDLSLELRVDIDETRAHAPVLNRLSGDLYQEFSSAADGQPHSWRIYQESFIVDHPTAEPGECSVTLSGDVRWYFGAHLPTTLNVKIQWEQGGPADQADALLTMGTEEQRFACKRISKAFRSISLEIDIAASKNQPPLEPAYDTHAHDDRPADLAQRTLTIEEAFGEAGIQIDVSSVHTVIDDSAAGFETWTPAELHDAMEDHFSQYDDGWPNWRMWGLLCGKYRDAGVGGIMFDAASNFDGEDKAPERQGFAVFRDHHWFEHLPAGAPSNQTEAAALRKFLFAWVHEAGHAFNLKHSFEKLRPNALSWLNYDERFDIFHGLGAFWKAFGMRFDEEELVHLRHGDRNEVIMGADPFGTGGHLESGAGWRGSVEGSAPLELLVRTQDYFEFMEPVSIEVRLRNLLEDSPLEVDRLVSPALGNLIIQILKPDGEVIAYEPVLCELAQPDTIELAPSSQAEYGTNRVSHEVDLNFGRAGHYFSEPGTYRVRAIYRGTGHIVVTSNLKSMRVGVPLDRRTDVAAWDYFDRKAGLSLHLGGSRSDYLKQGYESLQAFADKMKDTLAGSLVGATLADGMRKPFYAIRKGKLKRLAGHSRARALKLADRAQKVLQKHETLNLALDRVMRMKAEILAETNKLPEAQEACEELRGTLEKRNVKASVLEEISAFASKLIGKAK